MKKLLIGLSSLRLTLLVILALIVVIVYDLEITPLHESWLAACFVLLALNLAAAIAVRTQFRRQPALLVFHLCLLAVVGLAAVQTLTGFDGRIELAENQAFSRQATEVMQQGPWHANDLGQVNFVQGPVEVDYSPKLRRGRTRSKVFHRNVQGSESTVFGDTQAYHDHGYRFITTPNKGYALTLTWLGQGTPTATGNIHMPSFPVREWDQQNHWQLPSGERVVLELEKPSVPVMTDWTLSSNDFDGRVFIVRQDGTRLALNTGNAITLDGGKLRLDEVGLWIGYRIESNAVLPWLFISGLLATLALGWHFWQNPPAFKDPENQNANNATA